MSRFPLLLLLAFAQIAPAQAPANAIDRFFKDTFEQMLRDSPEYATAVGRHEYDNRWTDYSKGAREQRRQFLVQSLTKLSSFPAASLSPDNRLTQRLIQYDFKSRLDSRDLEEHLLTVGQMTGFHNTVFVLLDRMPTRTVHDYENIVARLRAIPAYVDQHLTILDEAIAAKMTQSKIVTDRVLEQLTVQMNQTADQSALLAGFRAFPANIPMADQQRLKREALDAYQNQFLPSWRKLYTYMTATYAPHVRPADSLSSMPDGRAAYAILIRRLTTTNMSAEEIHSLGEREVKRIEGEMQAVLDEAGFKGSIVEFQQKLDADPQWHFTSKDEMLAYCRNIAKLIEPQLPNQFRNIPKLLYGIRPIPEDREAASATNAQAPSPDYSVPGWMNLNTYHPEKQFKYDKESLVLHEAVPGHVFQGSVSITQTALPDIRKFYSNSAFGEGWALYAESLGPALGMYRDPYSRFGRLTSERFRAVRLVVDTGIHELGWTRAEALDYFHVHAPEESVAEIDRYISWPAQALSYKMGELRIRALRTEAEKQLGAKFDVRDFNDAVIGEGRLPLDLLSEELTQFIASAGKK
ncbi:MAG: DUF885 domain-containing protein [Acidobacteriota bacterium]|nr:DUF885 domain-containing protein [Acidobacteriota bacterium]